MPRINARKRAKNALRRQAKKIKEREKLHELAKILLEKGFDISIRSKVVVANGKRVAIYKSTGKGRDYFFLMNLVHTGRVDFFYLICGDTPYIIPDEEIPGRFLILRHPPMRNRKYAKYMDNYDIIKNS